MRLRRNLIVIVFAAIGFLFGWSPTPSAHAGLLTPAATDCGSPLIENPFARYGDTANYFLAPGGHFEGSLAGWELTGGARLVTDSTTLRLRQGGAADTKALVIPNLGSAMTPTVCVGINEPSLRFAVKSVAGLGTLAVSVKFWGPLGLPLELPVGVVLAGRQWKPSPKVLVVVNLLKLLDGDRTPVAFRFRSVGLGASFAIDDVFIDPYRKG